MGILKRNLILEGYCRLKATPEELEESNSICEQSPRIQQVLLTGTIYSNPHFYAGRVGWS